MTVLPDHEIRALSLGVCKLIEPFSEEQLQPASYDTLIDSTVLVPESHHSTPIDTRKPAENRFRPVDISNEGFILSQGRFVLSSTIEWANIPDYIVGRIEGKSSRARQGIQIHSAGYLDPGFKGNVTLEIANFSPDPVVLWPGVMIAQLSFEYMSSSAERPYSSERNHYQNSRGPVVSRYGC